MARRLFLLLFSAFVGIFSSPEILMASDDYTLSGLNNAGIVETVPIVEETVAVEENVVTSSNVGVGSNSDTRNNVRAVSTQVLTPAPVYVASSNSISVAGRTLEIVDVTSTAVDSGNHVNKYGERFLYGHNSAGVFGGLVNLGVDSTFSVAYGGKTTNYRVAKIVIFEKNVETGRLQLNGAGNYMKSVANAKSDGVQYSLSLMTCYGASYGNGDASHRLVIFANAM